jgi:hypothetical protein
MQTHVENKPLIPGTPFIDHTVATTAAAPSSSAASPALLTLQEGDTNHTTNPLAARKQAVLYQSIAATIDVVLAMPIAVQSCNTVTPCASSTTTALGLPPHSNAAHPTAHLDQHSRLVVSSCAEHLLLLGGDRGVAGNEHSHHTAGSLQSQ